MKPHRYQVSVPATSANLGPGFDRLGLALALRMEVSARVSEAWSISYRGQGQDAMPANADNLIARAYREGATQLGEVPLAFELAIVNPIPISRGMGSSATAIVAGLALAQCVHTGKVDRETVFQQAARYEGHPDNVAPAVFGGLQVCEALETGFHATPAPISPNIRVLAVSPSAGFSTKEMRGILPTTFDAETLAHNALAQKKLLEGLAIGDPEGLRFSEADLLHQPYRLAAQPTSQVLFQIFQGMTSVAGAYLSGSGPTIGGWLLGDIDPLPELTGAMAAKEIIGEVRILDVDRDGLSWVDQTQTREET